MRRTFLAVAVVLLTTFDLPGLDPGPLRAGEDNLLHRQEGIVRYIEKGMPDNQRILREIDKLFHQPGFVRMERPSPR